MIYNMICLQYDCYHILQLQLYFILLNEAVDILLFFLFFFKLLRWVIMFLFLTNFKFDN